MSLNYEADKTYHQFDSAGMLVVKDDPESWKDSIGRTVLAWIAYGKPEELKESVNDCTVFGNPWNLLRHPNHPEEFASRDHFSYWITLQKLTNSDYGFKNTIACLPRMRGMNFWIKAIAGSKLHERLYYAIYIPGARLGNAWNRLIMRIGKAGPDRTNEWWITRPEGGATNGELLQRSLTRWQKFWLHGPRFKLFGKECHIEILVPAYPLHNKGWQLYVMPESRRKERLKKILLSRIEISNIMLRLLFAPTKTPNSQDSVTQEEVDNYPHMSGFRPGVYYPTCDRHIRELTDKEAKFNAYEKDLIIWLWHTIGYEGAR